MISAIITYDLGDYHARSRRLSLTISAIITGGVSRRHGLDYDLVSPRRVVSRRRYHQNGTGMLGLAYPRLLFGYYSVIIRLLLGDHSAIIRLIFS